MLYIRVLIVDNSSRFLVSQVGSIMCSTRCCMFRSHRIVVGNGSLIEDRCVILDILASSFIVVVVIQSTGQRHVPN